MLRIVVDTNIWIRTLLGGPVSLPVLAALRENRFKAVISEALLKELQEVAQRPRLKKRIDPFNLNELLDLLTLTGDWVELTTIPPRCRDPKDHPVLATAIDGRADAIVTGDDDLRADDELRAAMNTFNVQLWGMESFIAALKAD
jgi:putative PIN family toxin of toxin-antitoxin system